MHDLKGIITPIVTVFNDNESIDEAGYRKVIDHLIHHGVNGIFACGGQGEGISLTVPEKEHILAVTLEQIDGAVPVLMGTGAVTTRAAIELTRMAEKGGADYATVITPHYLSPTQDELYDHYRAILDATDIPILIYNNPWRTHLNIKPETVARLCEYSPNMYGIKDSSGDLAMTMAYKRLAPDRQSGTFRVFIGRDQLIHAALASGLDGAVAATSNAAIDIVVGIYREFISGNAAKSKELQDILIPLREAFALGTFPVLVKEAMTLQGLPAGPCRAPVGPMSETNRGKLRAILKNMDLIS